MTIHMLQTSDVPPVPENVNILSDWGSVTIHSEELGQMYTGNHIAVEGTEDAIKDWLRPLNGFWLGVGSPMMQEFIINHVK